MIPNNTTSTSQSSQSLGVFALLLLAIFDTEMAVMELFAPLFARMNLVSASLVDAAILSLIYAVPLWFFFIQPLCSGQSGEEPGARIAPAGLFAKALAVIFLVEFLVMLILLGLLPQADIHMRNMADACLTILFSTPLLWWVLFRPAMRKRRASLDDLLGTPVKLYVLLLFTVFLVDLLQEQLVHSISPGIELSFNKIVESFLTTLISAPFLWWFIARPLKVAALSEKIRSDAVCGQVVDAIVTIDAQGVIESFNPAAERIFGHPAAEIIGQPAKLLFSAEPRCLDELVREAATGNNGSAPHGTLEIMGRRRDGSVLTMDVSSSRVLMDGKPKFLVIMRDIDDRVEMENSLRSSLSLLTSTLESTADGILVIDGARKVQIFNQKFLDMWRIPRKLMESSTSRQLLDVVKEQLQDPDGFTARTEELYGTPGAAVLDIIRFRDGRVYERYSQPRLLEGEIAGRVWSFRDITVRMHAEEALRKSEERFDILVNGANEGIWDWNLQTGVMYCTSRFEELLGYAEGELENDFEMFASILYPEDSELFRADIDIHLREQATFDNEYRLMTKAGDYRWFRVRGQAVCDGSHQAVRMVGSISDVTKRKQAEEALRDSETRFRQIFEQSEDAIIFFKPGTCSIIDVNATAERLYGYTKAEFLLAGLGSICRSEDFARLSRIICSIRNGETAFLDKVANLRKDGTEFIVSMRGKVMTLQGVDIIYCTFRDISERVRMEEEALEIQAKLFQTNKMAALGLMVSGVAHEINNPNNFIMANSEFLAMAWEDALKILREYYRENGDFFVGGIPFSEMSAQAPQLMAGIIDGSRRINEIVNNLKRFARQDKVVAGRDVDVNQVVTMAVSIIHHELVKHTENFHLDLAENIPHVQGSNQQLGQVVINLLMNACQALPAKGCGIWVTTAFDAAADQVAITIRDEGRGMSRDVSSRILEPFFTTKLDRGGTGLGLAISHSIVKEHNGSLVFESEPDKGTTFIVRIPAGKPVVAEGTA